MPTLAANEFRRARTELNDVAACLEADVSEALDSNRSVPRSAAPGGGRGGAQCLVGPSSSPPRAAWR